MKKPERIFVFHDTGLGNQFRKLKLILILVLFCVFQANAISIRSNKTPKDLKQSDVVLSKAITKKTGEIKSRLPEQIKQKVTGTVTDQNGMPLPGVSIRLQGTAIAAITDIAGVYAIDVSDVTGILKFTYVGFETTEISLKGNKVLNVTLKEIVQSLQQVVVLGYTTQKKVSVTAAVSTITSKELLQSPAANLSNSLVGRLPGLIAIQQSGEPGNDQSRLKIRGIGTLTDGAGSDPLILVDGVERAFNQIDPNEVDNISILKDASATAVFGVRGANGVILVTTKTGKPGKPQISFTSNFGLQGPTTLPKMVNSFDYATLKNEALANDGRPLFFTAKDLQQYKDGSDPIFHPNTDWFKMLLKPVTAQQSYNLNVSGGSDNTRYFVSLGYFDQNGAYKYEDFNPDFKTNAKYRRFNLRSNFDMDFNKNFSASIKLGGVFENTNYPGQSAGNIFFRVLGASPISNPGLIDGKLISSLGNTSNPNSGNPLSWLLANGFQNNFTNLMNLNVTLKHKLDFITKGLSVRGMLAYDTYYQHWYRRGKSVPQYLAYRNPTDSLKAILIQQGEDEPFSFNEGYSKWRKVYAEAAIDYTRTFSGHTVTGLVLYNQSRLTQPGLAYQVPLGYLGMVSRVTYNYRNRYLVEGNMGYNGSENFPKEKRFGLFPSVSFGYNLTEEPYFTKNDILTFLKLRGSYGEVGNDKIGGNRFLYLPSVFGYGGGYNLGEVGNNYQWSGGSYEGNIGNPDVTWERAKKTDIGLEFKLFKDKLSFTGDYFKEDRSNILWTLGTVPGIVQANLPPVNIGKMTNNGFEVEMGYNDHLGQFNYWLKGNYTVAKNKIIFKDEPSKQYPWMMDTGWPYGQPFGFKMEGFYNTNQELANRPVSSLSANLLQKGDMKYVDINGDGVIDNSDKVPIGYSTFPQVTYGVSFGGDFKGFDFSILFQGSRNASYYLSEMAAWPFDADWRNAQTFQLERWSQTRYDAGLPISYPRLYSSPVGGMHNFSTSDFWQVNSNYVRLKNAEIGYRFKSAFLARYGMKYLRVFANGINLLTWSDMKTYDPEAPSGRGEFYPQMRVFNAGINLQF